MGVSTTSAKAAGHMTYISKYLKATKFTSEKDIDKQDMADAVNQLIELLLGIERDFDRCWLMSINT